MPVGSDFYKMGELVGASVRQIKDDLADPTKGTNLVGYKAPYAGAVGRTQADVNSELVSVKDFGAVGDGATDDTTAIQNAVNYLNSIGGGRLFIPRGTYITAGIVVYSNIWLVGEGRSITTLKMKAGANGDVILGSNAYSLFGTNSGGGVQNVGLFDLTVDGNRDNNLASGNGVVLYGEEFYFQNLSVTQTRGHGIRTEWYRGDSAFGMESHYINVRIDSCGMDGWNNNGPHDSVTINLIVIDASMNTDKTYNGLTVGPNMTGRFIGCHVWNRAASNRHGWALKLESGPMAGGNEFASCHFEGAWLGNVGIFSSNNAFDDNCRFYSAWNGVNVYLGQTATFCVIKGVLDGPGAGRPDSVGITLGGAGSDWISDNVIDVVAKDQKAGAISFVNSDGNNKVTVRGYQLSGTIYAGTPPGSDIVDIRMNFNGSPVSISNIIQAGVVWIDANSSATFNFPVPFNGSPYVTFSPEGPSSDITSGIWISSKSPTYVSFYNNNPVSMTLNVIARRPN